MKLIRIYYILFLLSLTNYGRAQPVLEPDEYSFFHESTFRIKCKIKSDETGNRFYRWTGSVDSLNFVSWNSQDNKKLDKYSQTYLRVYYSPLEKKTRYKFSWASFIGGIDSTRFLMWDTTRNPRPYFFESLLDDWGRIKKLIRLTVGGDTIDIRRFEYDSLNHLSSVSWSRCNDCGVTMQFDSTTNSFISATRSNCNCQGNKLTFQYEIDEQGRVRKKTIAEIGFVTEKVTEIRTVYRYWGRKQINLYSTHYKRNNLTGIQHSMTKIPWRIRLYFENIPTHDSYYSVSWHDKKDRIKLYRYYSNNSFLRKKFNYQKSVRK
jgi:hypothetical protein